MTAFIVIVALIVGGVTGWFIRDNQAKIAAEVKVLETDAAEVVANVENKNP